MELRGLTTAAAGVLAIGLVSVAAVFGQNSTNESLEAVPAAAAAEVAPTVAESAEPAETSAAPEAAPSVPPTPVVSKKAAAGQRLLGNTRNNPRTVAVKNALPVKPVKVTLPLKQKPQPKPVVTAPVANVDVKAGTLLSKPLAGGRSSSRFGMRFHPTLHRWKLHTGHDWAAPCGTPVGASAAGTVTRVGWAGGNGMQIRIDHGTLAGKRVITTYNHLGAVAVKVGQSVKAGDGIGKVGNNGNSTGCHLHLEVIVNGQFTDPLPWLNGEAKIVTVVDAVVEHVTERPETKPIPTTKPKPTATASPSVSASPSAAESPSATPSGSATPSVSATPAVSQSASPSVSDSESGTPSGSPSASDSPTTTPSDTPTQTEPGTPEPTTSANPEPTQTSEPTTPEPTKDPSPTKDPDPSPTQTREQAPASPSDPAPTSTEG